MLRPTLQTGWRMFEQNRNSTIRFKIRLMASALLLVGVLSPNVANASANYGYDLNGRLVTTRYDNGLCVAYSYDANGNRTSQTNTISGTPELPTWGSGLWGCFLWTPH